ncbi:MAG: DUF1385 domain-containing protein [Chloroflexota bacterium]
MAKPSYGGQAVIEGVMMRGRRHFAVAVREPQGNIIVKQEALTGTIYTHPIFKLPFLRGPIILWDSLSLGMRTLMFSARVQMEAEGGKTGEPVEIDSKTMWGTVAIAMTLAIGLFFVVPAVVMSWLVDPFLNSALLSNLIEKVFRLAIIIGYIYLIGRLPDIQRVFAYHGAEHKAIHAWEAGVPLDVASVARFGTAHPRCGTSFLLVVVVVSFLAFSLLGQPPMLERVISRIVLIPFVAAVAYELIKFAAVHSANPLTQILIAPGMWLQKLTTREPDDEMLEVAIVSLRTVLVADGEVVLEQPAPIAQAVEASAL